MAKPSLLLVCGVAISLAGVSQAAPAHGTKPAPHPAKPAVPAYEKNKGTTQMAGAVGKLKQVYTLPWVEGSMNFSIESAEYTVNRANLGSRYNDFPEADEKLLLLHCRYKNPNKVDTSIDGAGVHFVAVDSDGANHESVEGAANEVAGTKLPGFLKPGQEVRFIKAIHVPAAGPIQKLILDPAPAGLKVLRFDINAGIAPIPTDFADTTDKTGDTPLSKIVGKVGTTYQIGDWDTTLVKAEYVETPLLRFDGDAPPEDGQRFAVFTFRIKCCSADGATSFGDEKINAVLKNADGDTVDQIRGPLLHATDDKKFNTDFEMGQEKSFRIYFTPSKTDKLGTLTLTDNVDKGRKITFDLDGVIK